MAEEKSEALILSTGSTTSILILMNSKLDRLISGQNVIFAGLKKLEDEHKTILIKISELASQLDDIEQKQQEDSDTLHRIESILTEVPLPKPLPITEWRLLAERQVDDMSLLDYEAQLPVIPDVPENADVEIQRITVYENGTAQSEAKDEAKDATVTLFTVTKGATVRLTRQLVDDDGNVGPVSASEEFLAADTIPPSAPGDFGEIKLVGERPDA